MWDVIKSIFSVKTVDSKEGLDSRWAKQTPNRAFELMKIIKDK